MSLMEQPWYWGNISKQQVADMMAAQQDGSFLVRDASTPGDYTLTIRFEGQTKLVRIHVHEGKCGFSADTLTHTSVANLIEFHRLRSLKIYNEQLDTCLRYPICRRRKSSSSFGSATHGPLSRPSVPTTNLSREGSRSRISPIAFHSQPSSSSSSCVSPPHREPLPPPQSTSPPTHQPIVRTISSSDDPEWQLRLGLERLRIAHTAAERAARLFDFAHTEIDNTKQLQKAQEQSLKDLDCKLEILTDVYDVQEKSKENAMDSVTADAMHNNAQVVLKYVQMISKERDFVKGQLVKLDESQEHLKLQYDKAQARIMETQKEMNSVFAQLRSSGVNPTLLDETCERARHMFLQAESFQVSLILADLPLTWNPAIYLVSECSKEAAASLIQQARARITQAARVLGTQQQTPPQGIFLIRPSASQPNKLVLSVLNGERISHCLIEQTDQGWGFENGGLYFVTIGDFTRYYAHTSLIEHNAEINTSLTVPALPNPTPSGKSPRT